MFACVMLNDSCLCFRLRLRWQPLSPCDSRFHVSGWWLHETERNRRQEYLRWEGLLKHIIVYIVLLFKICEALCFFVLLPVCWRKLYLETRQGIPHLPWCLWLNVCVILVGLFHLLFRSVFWVWLTPVQIRTVRSFSLQPHWLPSMQHYTAVQ